MLRLLRLLWVLGLQDSLQMEVSTSKAKPVSTCSCSLPASLGLLAHLKVLLLEGNPLRGIRRDLLTVGDLKDLSMAARAEHITGNPKTTVCLILLLHLLLPGWLVRQLCSLCYFCRKEPRNF